jgi:hypothetical protein
MWPQAGPKQPPEGGSIMQRILREDKLLETAEKLSKQIDERLPDSGLSRVAAEVVLIIKEATVRAATIRRPNLLLRASLVVLLVIAAVAVGRFILAHNEQTHTWESLITFLDTSKGMAAYMGAIALFLVTLETRLKRRRALRAVHELRAMAHLVDMHQLAKDPESVGSSASPIVVSGRTMNAHAMAGYLHYCTELLALVSKIGQLYVQDFPDAPSLAAVDQFENLTTGLSSKIWQKIMILDRIRADADGATFTATAPAHVPQTAVKSGVKKDGSTPSV